MSIKYFFVYFICSVFTSANAFSQSPKQEYYYIAIWQYSVLLKVDSYFIKTIPISIAFQMKATQDSSVSVFFTDSAKESTSEDGLNITQTNVNLNIDMPEKVVFDGQSIITYKSGRRTIQKAKERIFKPTKEQKIIEGYTCYKYEIPYDSSGATYAWICKDLPVTLTPNIGISNSPGAILEYEIPQKKARVLLLKIEKKKGKPF